MEFEKEKEDLLHDERYDRTIRALSAEVALKVMKSRVAISPMNATNTEFAKNIILDGANITMFDDSIVSLDDIQTNFIFGPEDAGKNKGELLKSKFNEMNPHAKIEFGRALSLDEIYNDLDSWKLRFQTFDILIISTTHFDQMLKWDALVQIINKPLYIIVPSGLFGFSWINLGKNYTFIEPKTQIEHFTLTDNTLNKSEISEKKPEFEEVTFDSFSLSQSLDPSIRNKSTIYYAICMMNMAQQKNLSYDPFSPNEEVYNLILDIGRGIYQTNKMKYNDTTENVLKNFIKMYGLEYCPVYSVLGSVCSQEFTKVMARNSHPAINWFCYDSQSGYGRVDCVQEMVYNRKHKK